MPTPDDFAHLQANIANLIRLNTDVHSDDKIGEIEDYLSADATTDRGHDFFVGLIETIFALAALAEFPGAAVVGAFLPVFFGANSPSGDMDMRFSAGAIRQWYDKTYEQADLQLSAIHDDPAKYWDTTFTSPVTGKQTLVSTLGAQEVVVPAEADNAFQQLMVKLAYRYRTVMTQALMSGLYKIHYSDSDSTWQWWEVDVFKQNAAEAVAAHPAWFYKYRKTFKSWLGKNYDVVQYFNFQLQLNSGDLASDKLCAWLMQDDGYGKELNSEGVARRADVFFNWNLTLDWSETGGQIPFGYDQSTYDLTASAAPLTEDESKFVVGDGPGHEPPS